MMKTLVIIVVAVFVLWLPFSLASVEDQLAREAEQKYLQELAAKLKAMGA